MIITDKFSARSCLKCNQAASREQKLIISVPGIRNKRLGCFLHRQRTLAICIEKRSGHNQQKASKFCFNEEKDLEGHTDGYNCLLSKAGYAEGAKGPLEKGSARHSVSQ